MTMICGERYKNLAVTSSGYSFDNAFGLFATIEDYTEWRAVAKKIMDLGHDHLVTLGEIEEVVGTYPKWNELVGKNNKLIDHYDNLPWTISIWTGAQIEEAISEAMVVVSEGMCFLDQVDAAISSYQRDPPRIPGIVPKKKPPAEFPKPKLPIIGEVDWGYVIVGALVVGGVVLYRRAGGSKRR